MNYWKTIIISDVHLGTRDCKAKELLKFLRENYCEELYLNGDILDIWKIHLNNWYWDTNHSAVVKEIITISESGTKVYYISGNHDETLRHISKHSIDIAGIKILDNAVHKGIDGIETLILHGDLFDGVSTIPKWIYLLGDKSYDLLLRFNVFFNWMRRKFGYNYWSISQAIKGKVKGAVNFICKFEDNLVLHCKKKGYQRIAVGHIHHADIKHLDGVLYMNSGDWVESCSALVEDFSGNWKILC